MPEYSLAQERKYYEQSDLWNRPLDPANRHRVLASLAFVPADVQNVLDVGCGNGVVTNHLAEHITTTALDLSASALAGVSPNARRVQGSALQLPFKSRSFDLVIASEVIEHFPDAQQDVILAELRRVTRRYLLIGVPAEEDIRGGTVTCPQCGARYHVNHHHRSYSRGMMNGLTGLKLLSLQSCGGVRATVHPGLRSLGRAAGGTFETPHALCPACAAPYPVSPRPLASIALKALNVAWRRMTGRARLRSHWIALYADAATAVPAMNKHMASAADVRMAQLTSAYAFGSALSLPGESLHITEGLLPGWNLLAWPRELFRALRSRPQIYLAANVPGFILGSMASLIRGGRVRFAQRGAGRPGNRA